MDDYILRILSGWMLDKDAKQAAVNLKAWTKKYPDFTFVAAACSLKAGDVAAASRHRRSRGERMLREGTEPSKADWPPTASSPGNESPHSIRSHGGVPRVNRTDRGKAAAVFGPYLKKESITWQSRSKSFPAGSKAAACGSMATASSSAMLWTPTCLWTPIRETATRGKIAIVTRDEDGWHIANEGAGVWLVNQVPVPRSQSVRLRSEDLVCGFRRNLDPISGFAS